MGENMNKIGRNVPCTCGSGKKYKTCCYLTEKNKFIVEGLNAVGSDSYFIRLKDNKEYFMHLDEDNKEDYVYAVKLGTVGAAIFHKEQGEGFIKSSGYTNLELVKVLEIVRNDGSLN